MRPQRRRRPGFRSLFFEERIESDATVISGPIPQYKGTVLLRLVLALALALGVLLGGERAQAQVRVELKPPADLSALSGRPLRRVEVVVSGARWRGAPPGVAAEAGQLLSPELVRRSLD